jgi:hypothetical protein
MSIVIHKNALADPWMQNFADELGIDYSSAFTYWVTVMLTVDNKECSLCYLRGAIQLSSWQGDPSKFIEAAGNACFLEENEDRLVSFRGFVEFMHEQDL